MSTTRKPKKKEPTRLEARVTASQKKLIERAAAYSGRSVTDFVTTTLATAAESIIHEHEVLRLNQAQSTAFAAALLNPPPPTAALRKAVEQHRRNVKDR